jgi:diguanylate cyclase (GGDEF)-like protein
VPPQPFTDPLSGDDAGRARRRLRHAGALLYAAGASTLGLVLVSPDPDPSDHVALGACAGLCAMLALALFLWRRAPAVVLHAICPAGSLVTTAAVAVAEPVGLTSIYYLLPLTIAAYFLRPREVVANLVLIAGAYGLTLVLWVEPVLRAASWFATLAVLTIIAAVVLVLKAEVVALVDRLRVLASHDALTGALNRGAFEQRLEAELARSARSGRPCALAVLDLDHFKAVNDRLGHAGGDDALRLVASVVTDGLRRADVFGRLGGEEFGVVLTETDAGGAAAFALHLRARLTAAQAGGVQPVTVSVGATDSSLAGGSVRTMLQDADRAMYLAKRAGRDHVVRSGEGAFAGAAPALGRR